ncbi:MAG TPA: hypothetical protein VF635_15035 [Propionibacteriaceae bacterium]
MADTGNNAGTGSADNSTGPDSSTGISDDGHERTQYDQGLSADLLDGLTEAVVKPADPRVRAKVIRELVHEVDEAVRWRHSADPGGQEEQSLAALVDAAAGHQERMAELSDPAVQGLEDATAAAEAVDERTLARRRRAEGSHAVSADDG